MMDPFSIQLLNQLMSAIERSLIEHPEHQLLMRAIENRLIAFIEPMGVNIKANWIKWLVEVNNALYTGYDLQVQTQSIKFAHRFLREQLCQYHRQVQPEPVFQNLSSYVQNVHLRRYYGFHDFSLIQKHLRPLSNMSMLRLSEYLHDTVYNRIYGSTELCDQDKDASNSTEDLPASAGSIFSGLGYKTDFYFMEIERLQRSRGILPRLFAGISEQKGGINNVASILIDGEANIRFMGYLDGHLDPSQSAYAHGPIFIMFHEEMDDMQQYCKENTGVYDVPIDCLTFLLPDETTYLKLACMLHAAIEEHLIEEGSVTQILSTQVMTFQQYYENHLSIEAEQLHREGARSAISSSNDTQTSSSPTGSTAGSLLGLPQGGSGTLSLHVRSRIPVSQSVGSLSIFSESGCRDQELPLTARTLSNSGFHDEGNPLSYSPP